VSIRATTPAFDEAALNWQTSACSSLKAGTPMVSGVVEFERPTQVMCQSRGSVS